MKTPKALCFCLVISLIQASATTAPAQPNREQTVRALKGMAVGFAAYLGGNVAREWAGPDRSLFSAPTGLDRFFRDALYQPGKTTNWLDANGLYYLIFGGLGVATATSVASQGGWDVYEIGYDAAAYSTGILLTGGLTRIIKGVVSRPRPYAYFGTRPIPEDTSEAYRSFVSGHASIAFYIAAFLRYRLNATFPESSRWQRQASNLILFGLATYTAYSRLQIDQHYVTDVVAGALLGVAIARLTHRWFYPPSSTASANIARISPSPGMIHIRIAF